MPSAQLLKTLMEVFHDPIRKLPPNAIGATSRVSVQRNIEKILRAWINVFWDDIVLAQDAVKEFQKWVNELAHGPKTSVGLGQQADGGGVVADDGGMYHYASCSLKPLLMTRIGGDAMSRLLSAAGVGSSSTATAASAASRSSSPHSPATPAGTGPGSTSPTAPQRRQTRLPFPSRPNSDFLDTIPIALLASHLHLADRYYASALTVPVLDNLARTGYPRTHTHVRIIRDYLAYTTGLFRWVLYSIDVAGPAPKRRVLVVKRMLKLAVQARDLGALNATCTIVGRSGVRGWCIRRALGGSEWQVHSHDEGVGRVCGPE
ncbi:hypothetical protein BCR44DRAFT_1085116 [Catenaria anguillulae PL171]|uniref:Uncharacterized protein n=1 Tax=Catenaria anguillulae PL171 TaxID=765915 RepID=A0A1Y2HRB9_9FUNG|nr:hypothetical protein BCR44DRAFT_1085116 [Catenaria anguillulae PL171]